MERSAGGRQPIKATRARVEEAIAELGFRPDGLARSLRLRRSHTVALIIPDITNPFFPVLARGLEDELSRSGYRTFICNTDGERNQELEFAWEVFHRRVDGIAIVALALEAADVAPLIELSMPFVSIGGHLDHASVDVVAPDDEQGAYDATMHLVRRGASRVAMIKGARGSGTDRVAGYRRALREAGLSNDGRLLVHGDWTRAGGARALQLLLAAEEPPEGVFCANDLMAIGALSVAREAGVAIPQDLALVGYDDIDAAVLVHPSLTTVLNPAYETGAAAAQFLLDRMARGYEGERRRAVLPCQLIVRDSA